METRGLQDGSLLFLSVTTIIIPIDAVVPAGSIYMDEDIATRR